MQHLERNSVPIEQAMSRSVRGDSRGSRDEQFQSDQEARQLSDVLSRVRYPPPPSEAAGVTFAESVEVSPVSSAGAGDRVEYHSNPPNHNQSPGFIRRLMKIAGIVGIGAVLVFIAIHFRIVDVVVRMALAYFKLDPYTLAGERGSSIVQALLHTLLVYVVYSLQL